jgi:hypothetical protein
MTIYLYPRSNSTDPYVMKTAIVIGLLLGAIGCGDNDAVSVDAGPAADACVMAQGNCGCVIQETAHYADGSPFPTVTTKVVCP